MPCQRGKDLQTKGQACDSKLAYNISPRQGGTQAAFRCAKCGHQWTVAMGGSFSTP
jgi:transposase-like protein